MPAWLAFSVIRLLEEHFPRQVSYEFTADMEDVLDEIAGGRADRATELGEFYYGAGDVVGLKTLVTELGEIDAKEMATFPIGEGIDLRVGRYGPYVEGPAPEDGDGAPVRANVPDDLPPDELTVAKAKELLANPAGEEQVVGNHPDTGLQIVAKNGRFGPYVTELLPDDAPKSAKPRTGSLFTSMTLDTVTLEQAVRLLDLPRIVGVDEDGTEITAQNGRYGPYLKKGTDSRSLTSEDQIFDITLDQAKAIYAQPKQRGRGAATPPLKELGNDPVSGQPVIVKAGRFGEYVTDGEYNATLRKDDTVESITLERAAELLAERRERGPAKKAAKKGARRRRRPRRRLPRRPRRRRRRPRRPPRSPDAPPASVGRGGRSAPVTRPPKRTLEVHSYPLRANVEPSVLRRRCAAVLGVVRGQITHVEVEGLHWSGVVDRHAEVLVVRAVQPGGTTGNAGLPYVVDDPARMLLAHRAWGLARVPRLVTVVRTERTRSGAGVRLTVPQRRSLGPSDRPRPFVSHPARRVCLVNAGVYAEHGALRVLRGRRGGRQVHPVAPAARLARRARRGRPAHLRARRHVRRQGAAAHRARPGDR